MIHELKIRTLFFESLIKGNKTFELRKNDRNYRVGDYLALNEIALTEDDDELFPDDEWEYTGRSAIFQITHIFEDRTCLQPDYVALGIKPCVVTQNYEPQVIDRNIGIVRHLHGFGDYPKVSKCNCE